MGAKSSSSKRSSSESPDEASAKVKSTPRLPAPREDKDEEKSSRSFWKKMRPGHRRKGKPDHQDEQVVADSPTASAGDQHPPATVLKADLSATEATPCADSVAPAHAELTASTDAGRDKSRRQRPKRPVVYDDAGETGIYYASSCKTHDFGRKQNFVQKGIFTPTQLESILTDPEYSELNEEILSLQVWHQKKGPKFRAHVLVLLKTPNRYFTIERYPDTKGKYSTVLQDCAFEDISAVICFMIGYRRDRKVSLVPGMMDGTGTVADMLKNLLVDKVISREYALLSNNCQHLADKVLKHHSAQGVRLRWPVRQVAA
jgi:hypothetical protein